ncbi:hypothetical protein RRG40_01150 [Mycoplasmopsis felis]|uniref:MG284/MPN403 family protein n=1 Tax=Mycoplasmopsis felis TaxID=33923 RepID=UPI002AFFB94A|nr:hypothetical protein [Mycoplasmopsis felis]WQQ05441.1 hypothetical protein RRG59_03780 [Mycoplasmopsis felis]
MNREKETHIAPFIFVTQETNENIIKNKDNYNFQLSLMKKLFDSYDNYKDEMIKKLLSLKLKNEYLLKDTTKEIQQVEKCLEDKNNVIHTILNYLTPRNASIIEKCYLDKVTKHNTTWYSDHFSKTTFYKYKKEAVSQFVNYFYNTIIST